MPPTLIKEDLKLGNLVTFNPSMRSEQVEPHPLGKKNISLKRKRETNTNEFMCTRNFVISVFSTKNFVKTFDNKVLEKFHSVIANVEASTLFVLLCIFS